MSELIESRSHLPAFMQQETDLGTDVLSEYCSPPRLKVVQTNARSPYDGFDPGDVLILPSLQVVAPVKRVLNEKTKREEVTEEGTMFSFVPVFFYREYCVWNPIETKGTLPAISARTFDKTHEIAIRALDPEKRQAPSPDVPGKFIKFVEHMNFIIVLMDDGPFRGISTNVSFARGEHYQGRRLADIVRMRRKAPLWGCQFVAQVGPRDRNSWHWLGLNVDNPPENSNIHPFIQDDVTYAALKKLRDGFKATFEKGLLKPEYETTDVDPELQDAVDSQF